MHTDMEAALTSMSLRRPKRSTVIEQTAEPSTRHVIDAAARMLESVGLKWSWFSKIDGA